MEHLQERSITTLSYLFVTHTDDDHLGGAVTLLDNFVHFGEVGTVAYNHDTHRIASGKRRAALQRLVQLARLHDLQVHNPRAGDGWEIQDLIIDVLHPAALDLNDAQLRANPNNASIVLKLTYAAKSILLPADLQGLGWSWILQRKPDLRADILAFPHHGAWYAPTGSQPSLPDVLQHIEPNLVIISAGRNNRYGHPHPNTIQLLRSLPGLRFMETSSGTVQVSIDSSGLSIL